MKAIIENELRPCIVNGEEKALFHRWEECTEIVQPSIMRGGHNGGVLKFTMGIVETESGQVIKVMPTSIRFLDNKIQEYAFAGEGSSTGGANEKE